MELAYKTNACTSHKRSIFTTLLVIKLLEPECQLWDVERKIEIQSIK